MPNVKGFQVRLTPEQKEEIRLLFWNGTHYEEIIERYGCSSGSFWNIVRDLHPAILERRFDGQLEALSGLPLDKLGWIAGILDGEGWVGITRIWNTKDRTSFSLMPRVGVASTTRIMQDTLRQILGCGTVYEKNVKQRRNRRATYAWEIWSAPVVGPFLTAIEPYLIVKRKVASVVREFCEQRIVHLTEPYTSDDLKTLKTVHDLNRRGVVDRRPRAA